MSQQLLLRKDRKDEEWFFIAAEEELSSLIAYLSYSDIHSLYFHDLLGNPIHELSSKTISLMYDWLHSHPSVLNHPDAERQIRTQAVVLFFGLAGTHLASRQQHFKHQRGTADQRERLLRLEIDYFSFRYDYFRPIQFVYNEIPLLPSNLQLECISISREPRSLSVGMASEHLRDALLKELHHSETHGEDWILSRIYSEKKTHQNPSVSILKSEYDKLGLKHTFELNSSLFICASKTPDIEKHARFFADLRAYLIDPRSFMRFHVNDSAIEFAVSEALSNEKIHISTSISAIVSSISPSIRKEVSQFYLNQVGKTAVNSEDSRLTFTALFLYAKFLQNPSDQFSLTNPTVVSLINQLLASNGLDSSFASSLAIAYHDSIEVRRKVDKIVTLLAQICDSLTSIRSETEYL